MLLKSAPYSGPTQYHFFPYSSYQDHHLKSFPLKLYISSKLVFNIEKENYITSSQANHPYYLSTGENKFILNEIGSIPEDMVFFSGGMTALNIPWLDHLEKIDIPSYYHLVSACLF